MKTWGDPLSPSTLTHVWGLSAGHDHGCRKYNLQDYRYLTLEAGTTHSSNAFSNLWANGSDTFSAEKRDSLGILSWSCRHSSPHRGSSRMRSGWLRADRGSTWADPLSERPQSWVRSGFYTPPSYLNLTLTRGGLLITCSVFCRTLWNFIWRQKMITVVLSYLQKTDSRTPEDTKICYVQAPYVKLWSVRAFCIQLRK